MTEPQAGQVLRDFRTLLRNYPADLSHVACDDVPDEALPPGAEVCDAAAGPTIGVGEYDVLLILPVATWASAQEAWQVFAAAHRSQGDPMVGTVGQALKVLDKALRSPALTALYALGAAAGVAAVAGLIYSTTRRA